MPTALFSFKVDSDEKIRVAHIFFGVTLTAAKTALAEHAAICPKFGPAHRAEETVDIDVEIDDLPAGDEEEIGEWLDTFMGLDDLEDDDDPDDADDDEEEEEPER